MHSFAVCPLLTAPPTIFTHLTRTRTHAQPSRRPSPEPSKSKSPHNTFPRPCQPNFYFTKPPSYTPRIAMLNAWPCWAGPSWSQRPRPLPPAPSASTASPARSEKVKKGTATLPETTCELSRSLLIPPHPPSLLVVSRTDHVAEPLCAGQPGRRLVPSGSCGVGAGCGRGRLGGPRTQQFGAAGAVHGQGDSSRERGPARRAWGRARG